ncbi:hypothetical protein Tco_0556204 [Tanacetum coccineum]
MGEPLSSDRVFNFPVDESEPHLAYDFLRRVDATGYDDEIVEPIVEAEEHVIASVINMDDDIAMLFVHDDFGDDDSEGFDEEEVWEVDEEWLMDPITPPLMPVVPPLSIYEVGGNPCLAAVGQSFPPSQHLKLPPEVAAGITIRVERVSRLANQRDMLDCRIEARHLLLGFLAGQLCSRVVSQIQQSADFQFLK